MKEQWITFPSRGDARGLLVAMEASKTVPFEIRRVYSLVRLQAGLPRGAHAHRALRQVILALAGSCRVRLDDGRAQATVTLDDPARGLVLEPMVWHEMSDFSTDCVLLVLADAHYDEADYIRDRGEFLRLAQTAS